jgi:hypothetical protein
MAGQAKREKMSEKRRIVRKNRAGPNMRCTKARSLRWASVWEQVGIGKRAERGSLAAPDESTVNAGLNLRANPARQSSATKIGVSFLELSAVAEFSLLMPLQRSRKGSISRTPAQETPELLRPIGGISVEGRTIQTTGE